VKNQLIIIVFSSTLLIGCSQNHVYIPFQENPIEVFRYGGLSHGVGESLLDSPLLNDSLNALLLIANRKGLSELELSNIISDRKERDHRINELIKAGLMNKIQDQYFCSFPILLDEDYTIYSRLIIKTVDEIYPQLKPHLNKLLTIVDQREWKPWSYHIIWSLIFDSQFIWHEMLERSMVPPLDTVVNWVVYPQHKFKTGTNYYPDTELKDFWVVVSWSPEGSNTLGMLGGSWSSIYRLALHGVDSLSSQEIDLLTSMNLINSEQEAYFPVIHTEDTFFDDLKNTTDIYLNLMEKSLSTEDFQQIIGSNRKLCRAIAYHDISWEILGRLVNEGVIQRPMPLSVGNLTTEDDLTGVCSVFATYQPFIDDIMNVLENR